MGFSAVESASCLHVSTCNLSIALGALVGGLAFDRIGTTSVLWIGATPAILVLPLAGSRLRIQATCYGETPGDR